MNYLTFFIFNPSSKCSVLDAMTQHFLTVPRVENTAHYLDSIIIEQETNISIPNLPWIIKQLEQYYGEKPSFLKEERSHNGPITVAHFWIQGLKRPCLISYPTCNEDTGEFQIMPRQDHEAFVVERIIATHYFNESEPCSIQSVETFPKIRQLPVLTFAQLAEEYALQRYLKQKNNETEMAPLALVRAKSLEVSVPAPPQVSIDTYKEKKSLVVQVLQHERYIRECLNTQLAGEYLDRKPNLSFILRPSSLKKDGADFVFSITYRMPASANYRHIRFYIQGQMLVLDGPYGGVVNLNECTFDEALFAVVAKDIKLVSTLRASVSVAQNPPPVPLMSRIRRFFSSSSAARSDAPVVSLGSKAPDAAKFTGLFFVPAESLPTQADGDVSPMLNISGVNETDV